MKNLHSDIGLYVCNARVYCTFYQAMVYYYYYIYTRDYLQKQVKAMKVAQITWELLLMLEKWFMSLFYSREFLTSNFFYDEQMALNLLAESNLNDILLEVAKVRLLYHVNQLQ